MTRTRGAASSRRFHFRAIVVLGALAVGQNGCGSGNTGSLDLFTPVPSQTRPTGAGGLASDARVVPPGPSCPEGGCPSDECRIDSDCHSGSASRCDIGSSRCVECLDVSDCADGDRSLCDSASHVCVECLLDSDCLDPSKPGCFNPTGRCEECSADSHCSDGKTCDLTDGHCR